MDRKMMEKLVFITLIISFSGLCVAQVPNFGSGSEPYSQSSQSGTGYIGGLTVEPSSGYTNSYESSSSISYDSSGSENRRVTTHPPSEVQTNVPDTPSHPTSEPFAGNIPTIIPSASEESSTPYLYHGENPSLDDLRKIGGNDFLRVNISSEYKLRYYVLYNNKWYQNSTAYWYNQRTNSLMFIDKPQYIWAYEKYPLGQIVWKGLGYWNKGYRTGWFLGDAKGWHQLAISGSKSGQSNVLWIYVC